jgi:geranylgeranyl diphosphate synthase, type II
LQPLRDLFDLNYLKFVAETYCPSREPRSPTRDCMRYVLSGGGKRVRALFCLGMADFYGAPRAGLRGAVAVEMVHAYSLVHDDLPLMDNDDWRRGRPSAHRAFSEVTALLAGDALLTDAFSVLSDEHFFPWDQSLSIEAQLLSVKELSMAAGSQGMVLGQDLDVFFTGQSSASLSDVEVVHRHKTGALMGAAAALGAIAGGATLREIHRTRQFGLAIGHVFQLIDDSLDDISGTGKSCGKDASQGKLTYRSFMSADEIRKRAKGLTQQALDEFGLTPENQLFSFIRDLVFREH